MYDDRWYETGSSIGLVRQEAKSMLDMVEELELVTKHSRLTNWCEKNFDVETRGRGHATIRSENDLSGNEFGP